MISNINWGGTTTSFLFFTFKLSRAVRNALQNSAMSSYSNLFASFSACLNVKAVRLSLAISTAVSGRLCA